MLRNLIVLLCLIGSFASISAQTREDQARGELRYGSQGRDYVENESGGIWYGAGAQLGFQGGNNQSSFQIGISPIAGYKLNNFLSVGPRASLVYNNFKFGNFKDKSFSYSVGPFVRAKVFRSIFIHGEYDLLSENEFVLRGNQIEVERVTRAIPFLGAGLNQGGGIGATGFELLLLFRLTQPDRLNDAPYEFRSGLNYNF